MDTNQTSGSGADEDEVKRLAQVGKLREAITLYRQIHPVGVAAAADALEAWGFTVRQRQAPPEQMTLLLNRNVLHFLSREGKPTGKGKPKPPTFASWNSVPDAYSACGCHPDVVARLWDEIGAALPTDCRSLVCGTPGLVHPKSGVVLAVGFGTAYGLRLPGLLFVDALNAGAKTVEKWSTGESTDIQRLFGQEWVFGVWLANEPMWCKKAYEIYDPST